jgi:hypothetical protein
VKEEDIKRMYPPSGRGQMRKIDIEPRIFNLKHELYNNYRHHTDDWHAGAHYATNRVLQILQEYYS